MSFGVALQVAIGLVFIYLLVALLVSAFQELVEALLRKRANFLLDALKNLIGGTSSGGSAFSYLMTHPLIKPDATAPTSTLTEDTIKKDKLTPSYIPARNFALVLLEFLRDGKASATIEDINASVDKLPDGPKQILTAFLKETGNDLDKFKARIETWFDDAMDRVSGLYKRYAQKFAFWIGVTAAIIFNVDSIGIARTLWLDPSMRTAMSAAAEAYVKDNPPPSADRGSDPGKEAKPPPPPADPNLVAPGRGGTATPQTPGETKDTKGAATVSPAAQDKADTRTKNCTALQRAKDKFDCLEAQIEQLPLPLGWQPGPDQRKNAADWNKMSCLDQAKAWANYIAPRIPGALPGWFITALAISLGAPFWFDILKLLINIRAAGPKPGRSEATRSGETVPDRRRG